MASRVCKNSSEKFCYICGRSVPHSEDLPVPVPSEILDISSDNDSSGDSDEYILPPDDNSPQLFDQDDLGDLIRDLNLPKSSSEILASRLKEKNLLLPGANISKYRTREQDFLKFFHVQPSFVYCGNIPGLIEKLGVKYNPEEWRLFIDSSKRNLKGV
ncbi:hypothetical protein LOD99_15180 [Oopsacas minuta]|uniref:Uncharacterized protein n=1 Tax=Oopsacas minuta TaxID=111878 RepID=A0AAV7KDS8_9METZ|nr:hypothetical protein LOD99_15180 [Oopsacas minuta]